MHSMGLHSALAIKRQRRRREELRKARERRFSSHSTESGMMGSRSSICSPGSLGGSMDRLKSSRRKRTAAANPKAETSSMSHIGMLHIGIVFLVFGLFLVGSGIVPDDYEKWNGSINWTNELVFSGLTSMIIGLFLIVLNHYLSQKEDDQLTKYVENQLQRSKSGKILIKDEETGGLSTKQDAHNKHQQSKSDRSLSDDVVIEVESSAAAAAEAHHSHHSTPNSPPDVVSFAVACASTNHHYGPHSPPKPDLERILEEDPYSEGKCSESVELRLQRERLIGPQNEATSSPRHSGQKYPERELVVTRYYNTTD